MAINLIDWNALKKRSRNVLIRAHFPAQGSLWYLYEIFIFFPVYIYASKDLPSYNSSWVPLLTFPLPCWQPRTNFSMHCHKSFCGKNKLNATPTHLTATCRGHTIVCARKMTVGGMVLGKKTAGRQNSRQSEWEREMSKLSRSNSMWSGGHGLNSLPVGMPPPPAASAWHMSSSSAIHVLKYRRILWFFFLCCFWLHYYHRHLADLSGENCLNECLGWHSILRIRRIVQHCLLLKMPI